MADTKRLVFGKVNFFLMSTGFGIGCGEYHLTICQNINTGLFDIHLTKQGRVNKSLMKKTFTVEDLEKFGLEYNLKLYRVLRQHLKRVKVCDLERKGYFIFALDKTRFEKAFQKNSPIGGKPSKPKRQLNWKGLMSDLLINGPGWMYPPHFLNKDPAWKKSELILAQSFRRKHRKKRLGLINLPRKFGYNCWYSLPYDSIPKWGRSLFQENIRKEGENFMKVVMEKIPLDSLESELDLSGLLNFSALISSRFFEHVS